MTHYDITIIGAGPAGATLARQLQNKYKVLLVDKRPLDKEPNKLIKNCGGLIAPDAQKALAGFGLSIPKEVLVSPQMFSVETLDFDNEMTRTYQRHYINVDRERYDRWLVSLCNKKVEKTFNTRFRGAVKKENHYEVTLLSKEKKTLVTTDIIIGADGANSKVKKSLLPKQHHAPKRYISIQEWFPNTMHLNQYVAMFDEEISDFYSWIIPKENGIIFGSAIPEGKDATTYHNRQKEKLKKYGYHLSTPTKKEGCLLLRPMGNKEIYLGKENIALVGEAAGFISPTSAEGISYAMLSGNILAQSILENKENFLALYTDNVKSLKSNIDKKMLKYPAMYNKTLRKWIFKLGLGSMHIEQNRQTNTYVKNKVTPFMVEYSL
jgi:geranylgeranyl reductase family protein